MPRLDIFPIVHTSISSLDPAEGPTFGPSNDPLAGVDLNLGSQQPRTPADSAVLNAPSAMANIPPAQAPSQGIVPLPAAALAGLGGMDSPNPPYNPISADPAPAGGPSYDPGLQQLINQLSGLGDQPRRNADPSPPVTASAAGAAFFPFGDKVPLGAVQVTARPFAGAGSPVAPSALDSSDPVPPAGGPSYDPGVQQIIDQLSGLSGPPTHSEPIQTSRNTLSHRVRIDP